MPMLNPKTFVKKSKLYKLKTGLINNLTFHHTSDGADLYHLLKAFPNEEMIEIEIKEK